MKNALTIFEQVEPTPNEANRFRIVEMQMTIDGPRSRMTHTSFATYAEAAQFVKDYDNGHSQP